MAPLNVIALVSGGKDSMYSILHCLSQGHRVIALANLSPPDVTTAFSPSSPSSPAIPSDEAADLNSFMFQTAGHTLISLYSQCLPHTPLYRRAIAGGAVTTAREYAPAAADETEDMLALLRIVLAEHPCADAVCSGAILSTYQRTRVESVAVRLGLAPLAFLWQYPILPFPGPSPSMGGITEPAALLRHMAAAGMDARIIKVASGGLDERFLWANLCDERTITRVEKAVGRFGGSVLGEGGEFETLIVQGPRGVWRRRIVVEEGEMKIVKGEGGEAWLNFGGGRCEDVEDETEGQHEGTVGPARPTLFDESFEKMRRELLLYVQDCTNNVTSTANSITPQTLQSIAPPSIKVSAQVLFASNFASSASSISEQTTAVFESLNSALRQHGLSSIALVHILVVLRRMSDFAAFNAAYISGISSAPLPPSRVTIANGSVLPDGCDVMLSAVATMNTTAPRYGLHVQSRSFWAPANIGPYSQARHLPAYRRPPRQHQHEQTDLRTEAEILDGAALVHIAGQIPLAPATMELLDPSTADELPLGTFATRAALALQHLWRIGLEREVGFWTGAVAYIARSDSFEYRARVAGRTWAIANGQGSGTSRKDGNDDEEEDEDIDVWDRTHLGQPSWASAAQQEEPRRALPDWPRIRCDTGEGKEDPIVLPPFFAVEVDELPRGSEIEWQSHGLRAGRDESVTYHIHARDGAGNGVDVSMRARSESNPGSEEAVFPYVKTRMFMANCTAKSVNGEVEESRLDVGTEDAGCTVYATGQTLAEWQATGACIIPCRRICGYDGTEIAAVVQQLVCR